MKKTEEQKKGTPIKVTRLSGKDYPSKNGMLYAFSVVFNNGDKGQYKARDVNNPKFKEGVETDYILEKVVNDEPGKEFTMYNIKSISTGSNFGSGYKPRTMSKEEQVSIFKQVVMEKSIEFERELIKAKITINIDMAELRKHWLQEVSKKGIAEEVNQQLGMNASSAFKITLGNIINKCLQSNSTEPIKDFDTMYEGVFNYIKV